MKTCKEKSRVHNSMMIPCNSHQIITTLAHTSLAILRDHSMIVTTIWSMGLTQLLTHTMPIIMKDPRTLHTLMECHRTPYMIAMATDMRHTCHTTKDIPTRIPTIPAITMITPTILSTICSRMLLFLLMKLKRMSWISMLTQMLQDPTQ